MLNAIEAPIDTGHTRATLLRTRDEFTRTYLTLPGEDEDSVRIKDIMVELSTGTFWWALTKMDGHPTSPDAELEQVQRWSRSHFSEEELFTFLQSCVDTALLPRENYTRPGEIRGHSILYDHLYLKSRTIFRRFLTESFRRMLINGRFWEDLPRTGSASYVAALVTHGHNPNFPVGDILANHFDVLEGEFAPKGYILFKRNGGENKEFDLDSLSQRELERYRSFMSHIAERKEELGFTQEQIDYLIAPADNYRLWDQ